MKVVVPDNCLGIDGARQKYNARHGVVDIDQDDADLVRQSWAGQHGMMLTGVTFTRAAGTDCACGFAAFEWQKKCPRCGRRLKR